MKHIYYHFLALMLISNIILANSGEISGTIIDKTSGVGIPGVNIYLEGTTLGDFTDGKGNYRIIGINEGSYSIVASSIGYHQESQKVGISSGEKIELSFSLIESVEVLEGVIVNRASLVGGSSLIEEIPGSAHYISPRELNKFSNTDINRILRNIPGIIIQEEDGYGLRPNIGMRGTGLERSSKITIMEDGILMAPAPYAAPEAYYFPSSGRMSGIEVRKGSSQIKYGPYTTGGAINLLSTTIPNSGVNMATRIIGGNDGYTDIYGTVGASTGNIGFMVESLIQGSDGFKDLDNGDNTGFMKEDYILKMKVNTNKNAKIYQSLSLKAGLTKENSNETYLGLTEQDFDLTPYRRYAGSQVDNMLNKQTQYSLRHIIRPAKFIDITTTLYRTNFERNWYKTDQIKSSDSTDKVSIAKIFENTDQYLNELGILQGETSSIDNAIFVKSNNRSYYAQGIESIIGLNFVTATFRHDIEIGLRFHKDQMDRYQWVDEYKMLTGAMLLTKPGLPGTDSNYLLDANAFATYIQYKFSYYNLSVTPGLRYENINYMKTDYGKIDPERSGSSVKYTENNMDIYIPGIGFDYKFTETTSSFLGIHKGFTPPGITEGTVAETSINYEAGLRYQSRALTFQPVLYYNDYDNLLGADLASSGGTGSASQFNGGKSLIYGLELESSYNFLAFSTSRFMLPLTINYTYTNATFQNTFESEFEPWGQVEEGDAIPYIPEHQLVLNMGLQHKRFELNLSSKFIGEMRTKAGKGEIPPSELINSHFVADLSANVHINRYVGLFGSVLNLFDAEYLVSRRPAGLRPGMPRSFRLGIKANLN